MNSLVANNSPSSIGGPSMAAAGLLGGMQAPAAVAQVLPVGTAGLVNAATFIGQAGLETMLGNDS
jgi:hypothetical protein